MNRREFLSGTLAAAVGLEVGNSIELSSRKENLSSSVNWEEILVEIPKFEIPQTLSNVLNSLAVSCYSMYLTGGAITVLLRKLESSVYELIVSTPNFTGAKKDLFLLGVVPIANPEEHGNRVAFHYKDALFYVENISMDSFAQRKIFEFQRGLLAFSHRALALNPVTFKLWDPYKVCSQVDGDGWKIQLQSKCTTDLLSGTSVILEGLLEACVFKLSSSSSFNAYQNDVLNTNPTSADALLIGGMLADTAPSLLHYLGMDRLMKMLSTPLANASLQAAFQKDVSKVYSDYLNLRARAKNSYTDEDVLLAAIMIDSDSKAEPALMPQVAMLRSPNYNVCPRRNYNRNKARILINEVLLT